nr:MAG TPA: hypothetical protein [Caudoviricetes sp.]DAO82585.1 MAG TPA: hypothetical protein [Caudoviricetes sp.]
MCLLKHEGIGYALSLGLSYLIFSELSNLKGD